MSGTVGYDNGSISGGYGRYDKNAIANSLDEKDTVAKRSQTSVKQTTNRQEGSTEV